jgi:hypothetical protein
MAVSPQRHSARASRGRTVDGSRAGSPRSDRSRPRAEPHSLLERGLAELLSRAVPRDGPPPAAPPPDRSPLVIVDPAGGGATSAVGDFFLAHHLDHTAATGAPRPLPDVATIWDGRSLGQTIARAVGSDHLDQLAAVFLTRPVAVIDDVDRLGRPEIQAAFVHLFDTATHAGIALCLSVARHPAALETLEPNVVSRLVGGLVVRPRSATPEARFAGCRSPSVSLARVLRAVARHHELDVATLVGPSRRRAIAEARSLAMYVARAVTDRSLQAIGAACGGRDHTTALHATRTQAARIAADPAFAADVERIIEQCVGRVSGVRELRGRRPPDISVDT